MTMLLSLMVMSVSSFTYQTEYNYQRSTFGTTSNYISHNNTQSIEYRGIGYTTNYSNGQFNSTQYYHTPSQSSSGRSRPCWQPRRAKGYDETGKEYDTGSGEQGNPTDLWDTTYEYKWDGTYWYRTNDDGKNWEKWHTTLHLWYHWWGWGSVHPGENAVTLYPDNPVPIGDNYIWFMVCIVSIYSLVKAKRNKLKHSAY